jgi:hypothetical protein
MSTMMSKIEEFVERNGMSESTKSEMLEILNESLLEISRGIMENNRVKVKVDKFGACVEKLSGCVERRYKSKKAEEYAKEHGLSLEEFEMKEVSKKDVEVKVREIAKNKKENISNKIGSRITNEKKEENVRNVRNVRNVGVIKRERVICSGINKKGEACRSVGTIRPEGAKKTYCFRHAEDFKAFECDSDSSDEDIEEKEEDKVDANAEKEEKEEEEKEKEEKEEEEKEEEEKEEDKVDANAEKEEKEEEEKEEEEKEEEEKEEELEEEEYD